MSRHKTPIRGRGPGTLLGVAALCAMLAPALARADTVTDWNAYASTAIVTVAKQPPPVAVLSFAMVQGAVYDAVAAIDGRYRPYLPTAPARRRDSEDAAAATAAFRVLAGLFPDQQATLQPRYDASLAGIADGPRKTRGIADGERAATAILAARRDDGRDRLDSLTPVTGSTPGAWRPTPPAFAKDPAPGVANVRPFLVPSVDMLRTAGPHPLTSRAYARDFDEIKRVGALHSTTRTADETDAAIFWQEHAYSLFNRAFRTLAANHHLSLADSARMLAMTNLAGADAAIGCWHEKYRWNFWRPITAIREADADGNPATTADKDWLPLFDPSTPVAPGAPPLVTPPFPDNPSGHLCATGAIVRTLRHFFGSDRVPLSLHSNQSGTTRRFARLSGLLREVLNARVWAGIHFRTADVRGAQLGEKVARYERRHYFQPARGCDHHAVSETNLHRRSRDNPRS
jgi:PAP2 superfamily